jgi:hypothetical protein
MIAQPNASESFALSACEVPAANSASNLPSRHGCFAASSGPPCE